MKKVEGASLRSVEAGSISLHLNGFDLNGENGSLGFRFAPGFKGHPILKSFSVSVPSFLNIEINPIKLYFGRFIEAITVGRNLLELFLGEDD